MCIHSPKDGNVLRNDGNSFFSFQLLAWITLTFLMKEFSIRFPHWVSQAGRDTFLPAQYKYDSSNTVFDNSILTWGTDYGITCVMIYGVLRLLSAKPWNSAYQNEVSWGLRLRAAALLLSYAISVFAGGIAHQNYSTIDSLNSLSFRILWTICVGSVTAAGGYMGMCGSEICRRFHTYSDKDFRIPVIPDHYWVFYGLYMTFVCACGGISCKRPACDIFIAGVSQIIPTAYCEVVLMSKKWHDAGLIERKTTMNYNTTDGIMKHSRYIYYIGFILNAPLLPLYPVLVQYTSLPLGVVNMLLHCNLTLSWGLQAIGLFQICQAIDNTKHKN